ncbi:MAG TPA: pilus assembly protein PilM, partial [Candidatus Paceibacterota bacterium]
ERAETMKREAGLSKDSSQREVTSVMEPILEYIFYEAGNVIREYQRKDKHTIGRMIILGGGSLLIGLADFAVKRLSIEVNLSDPFSKVEYPAVFENVLKKVGPSFAVAVGLALRDL